MADANTEAANTVKNVEKADHFEGATSAYSKLVQEFNTYNSSHSKAETDAYWTSVQSQLQQDNVLNDLSIGWAKENSARFSDDGSLSKRYLSTIVETDDSKSRPGAPNAAKRMTVSALDETMAQTMVDQYDRLTKMHNDASGGLFGLFSHEDYSITSNDVDAYLLRNKTATEQNKAIQDMAPLFAGEPSLFKTLDGIGALNKDNKITMSDLKKYLSDYDERTNNGQHPDADGQPFSQKNHDFVTTLLNNWYGPEGRTLRSGAWGASLSGPDSVLGINFGAGKFLDFNSPDGEINLNSLGRAAGISDVKDTDLDDFTDKFNARLQSLKVENVNAPTRDTSRDQSALTSLSEAPDFLKAVTDDGTKSILSVEKLDSIINGSTKFLAKDEPVTADQLASAQVLKSYIESLPPGTKVTLDDLSKSLGNDADGWEHQLKMTGHGTVSDSQLEALQKLIGSDASFVKRFSANGKFSRSSLAAGTYPDSADQGLNVDEQQALALLNDSFYTLSKGNDDVDLATLMPSRVSTSENTLSENAKAKAQFDALDPATQSALSNAVVDDFIKRSQPQPGDGFISIAARILGVSDHDDSDPAVNKLWTILKNVSSGQLTDIGSPMLTTETLKQMTLQDEDLQNAMLSSLNQKVKDYIDKHG